MWYLHHPLDDINNQIWAGLKSELHSVSRMAGREASLEPTSVTFSKHLGQKQRSLDLNWHFNLRYRLPKCLLNRLSHSAYPNKLTGTCQSLRAEVHINKRQMRKWRDQIFLQVNFWIDSDRLQVLYQVFDLNFNYYLNVFHLKI